MKTTSIAIAAFLIAACASAACFFQLRELREERQQEAAELAERAARSRDASERQASLERRIEELSAKLGALEARGPATGERKDSAGLSGAVAAAGAERAAGAAGAAGEGEPAEREDAAGEAKGEARLAEYLDELAGRGTGRGRRQAIWNEIREGGLLDRAIEEFENRAKENPR